MPAGDVAAARGPRRLPWWGLLLIFVAWFVASFAAEAAFGTGDESTGIRTVRAAVAGYLAPALAGAAVVAVAVLIRRRWHDVWRDDRPVRRWLWALPVVYASWYVAKADWADMPQAGAVLVLVTLISTLAVGLNEELLTRGALLVALRDRSPEWVAALVSTLVFSALHLIGGGGAWTQAVSALPAGFLFYLARRISGGLMLPIALHGLSDWSILTHVLGDRADAPFMNFNDFLFELALALVILCMGHLISTSSIRGSRGGSAGSATGVSPVASTISDRDER